MSTHGSQPFGPGSLSLLNPRKALKATAHSLQFHETVLNGGCQHSCRWQRTDSTRLPWDSDGQYGGWGGTTAMPCLSVDRTPIVFVHGNQRDACDWAPHRKFFREQGYSHNELWAITFQQGSPTHDEIADQLEEFIWNVREYTGSEEVNVISHSLGVTGTRYWIQEHDRHDWVKTFVGIAGANHGVDYARLCCKFGIDAGPYRMSHFLRSDYTHFTNHPLQELNENETPGAIEYYTIRGTNDILFDDHARSPVLNGAEQNLALETDHDGAREDPATLKILHEWVAES